MTISLTRSLPASVLAVALALLAPHAATAADTVTVRFADLNTSTVQGSRALYARIRNAARDVCNSGAEWYPNEYWAQKNCYRATVARVVTRLNLPALTAVHLAQTQGELSKSPHG